MESSESIESTSEIEAKGDRFEGLIKKSRKSVRWSAVPVPCLSRLWLKLRGEQGSGPEGVDDLCFHTYGGFSPSPSPPPPPSLPPSNPSLEAQIPVSRPKSQS